MEKYLELGQIVNTFGIRGQVKVKPFTDDIKEFETFETIYVQKKTELIECKIESVRYGNPKAKGNRDSRASRNIA